MFSRCQSDLRSDTYHLGLMLCDGSKNVNCEAIRLREIACCEVENVNGSFSQDSRSGLVPILGVFKYNMCAKHFIEHFGGFRWRTF